MLKTFLVEDEVVIREMIKKMIPWEQYGFELAGEAADGEMALPLILKSKPDLLITDIKMPFMDGLTLCRLVKKELPDIRIVILRLEMQEYEKNASRDFFETLVRADSDLAELYRRADKLNLDIVAEAYNILIFTPDTSEGNYNSYEACSDWEAEVQDKINTYFLNHPVAILFRHQVFSYAILVKGQKDTIEKNTEECVKAIQDIMDQTERRTDWFIAVGKSAERQSMLGHS